VKSKIFILLFLLTIFLQNGFPQTSFYFGPEIGLTRSVKRSYENVEQLQPLIYPIIGISGLLKVGNHFQVVSGLQYEMIGSLFKEQYILKYNPNMTVKYNKLCIPVIIGISFGSTNIKPVVFFGYRPNILLSGKFKSASWEFDLVPLEYFWGFYHPNNFGPNKFTNQYIFGFSTYFGNNFVIGLTYCTGQKITFGYYIPNNITGYFHDNGTFFSIKNSEYAINIKWLFKVGSKSEKNSEE
jgi:hypothetical protein